MNLDYVKNVGLFFVPLFHQKKKKEFFGLLILKCFWSNQNLKKKKSRSNFIATKLLM